jgi:hypothetical protein
MPGFRAFAVLCQAMLVGCAIAPAADDVRPDQPRGPEIDGTWVVAIAPHLEVCPPPSAGAWAWSEQPFSISRLDPKGAALRSWTLPFAPRSIALTMDCRFAWALDVSRRRAAVIDERAPSEVVGLAAGQIISADTDAIVPCQDGSCAWAIETLSDAGPVLLQRASGGLAAHAFPLPPTTQLSKYTAALQGHALWAVPDGDPGLYLVDATGFHPYPALARTCIADVTGAPGGSIAWINPAGCGSDRTWKAGASGLYAVDARLRVLNHGKKLLASVIVNDVIARPWSDIAWVLADSEQLFAVRADTATDTITVVPLNGGGPVTDASGVEPLAVESVLPAPGRRAWVAASSRHGAPGVWGQIYQLELEGDRIKVRRQLEDQLPRFSIINVVSDRTDADRLWVRTFDRDWYEFTAGASADLTVKRLFVEGRPVLGTISGNKDQHDHYWLDAKPTAYLMGPASELSSATVELGATILTLEKASRVTVPILPTELGSITVQLAWPSRPDTSKVHGRISVDLVAPATASGAEGDAVAGGTARMAAGATEVHLLRSDRFVSDREYDLVVAYSDDNHSSIQARWHHVYFGLPWWKQLLYAPLVASLLWLLVPIVLVCTALRESAAIRAWAPVVLPSLEVIAAMSLPEYVKPEYAKLSIPHFLASAGIVTTAAILAGVTSPTAFRAIASSYPFKLVVPFALRLAFVRRRVFARYTRGASEDVQRGKTAANDERYVPLPIEVKDLAVTPGDTPTVARYAKGPQDGAAQRRDRADFAAGRADRWHVTVDELVDALWSDDPEQRVHVVIEAPGGRGKSALLRAMFERSIQRWRDDAAAPLPVLCQADVTTLEERAKIAFGSDAISIEHLALQLASGDLVLFVDGLSESRIDPGILARFLRDPGRRTRLCLAMRPSAEFSKEIAANADRYVRVEPQRLTDKTLDNFLAAYTGGTQGEPQAGATPGPEGPPAPVNGAVRASLKNRLRYFRGFDGNYVPLLVRLAMLTDDDSGGSISDVYDSCFERLLRNHKIVATSDRDELDRAAQDLSMTTYVENHQRIFSTNRDDAKESAAIATLLTCGVLVSADPSTRLGAAPRAVRFFHDSMQSYLAAKALGRKARWDILPRAAGDERFRRDRSDILGRSGSELFFMCVLGFGTANEVADYLRNELTAWATRHAHAFSADQITSAIPEVLRNTDAYAGPEGRDVASYLDAMIALAEHIPASPPGDDSPAPQPSEFVRRQRDYLAALYSTLAASVWAKEQRSRS